MPNDTRTGLKASNNRSDGEIKPSLTFSVQIIVGMYREPSVKHGLSWFGLCFRSILSKLMKLQQLKSMI